MIKYFEVSDFHFSPKWADHSIACGHRVAEAARREQPDFIALPGDFFDHPIYASDKGGLDIAKSIIREWLEIAPVVAIEGTPSHDAPGCYSIFEEMGLTLLKPGKVYYYSSDFHDNRKITEYKPTEKIDAILFGIPELNKNNLQAKLGLSAEEANAETIKLFVQYINNFVAPMRLKHSDVPAIGLLHGNVSDSHRSNETDIILKASDIVIYTEDLEPAGVDRWSLGHIHTPWESEKINAGYSGFTGMDSNPWGKLDFLPAFNMVTVHNGRLIDDNIKLEEPLTIEHTLFNAITDLKHKCGRSVEITRIPYGTPERRKVSHSSEILPFDNAAYWIDTDDQDDTLPEGLHPWSRITHKAQKTETRRVTEEQAESVQSLWDLFLLIDPDVNPELKKKVDLITETVKHSPPGKKDVEVAYVEIAGSKLFKGKTIKLDLDNLSEGLNMLDGGNGDGKSSLLSFCHPYPIIIGKDTKSGRDSAIKDFFSSKDSYIKKTVLLNGEAHQHHITIKGAHTQNPKTECYLTVAGIPQLEKATFDDMMAKCEELYGPSHDYRITSFCEQPQQASSNLSGLMSAKPIDARNLVQAIAGVDREAEKRFALDFVNAIEKEVSDTSIKIETIEDSIDDTAFYRNEKKQKESELSAVSDQIKAAAESGKTAKDNLESLRTEKQKNDEKIKLKSDLEQKIKECSNKIDSSKAEIENLKELSGSVKANKDIIARDDKARTEISRIKEIENQNSQLERDYLKELNAYNLEKSEAQKKLDKYNKMVIEAESSIRLIDKEIDLLNKPCEHCGKLPSTAEDRISELNHDRGNHQTVLKMTPALKDKVVFPDETKEPEYNAVPEKPSSLTDFERDSVLDDIKTGEMAGLQIINLENGIATMKGESGSYIAELSGIEIDETINYRMISAEAEIDSLRNRYTELSRNQERLSAEIKSVDEKIERIEKMKASVEELKDSIKTKSSDLVGWTYIAKMLGSDKIPALELDIVLETIDTEATRNVEPFLEGRYAFRTLTQDQGKKSKVDRFDIPVTDLETGEELSLFSFNPGHKAFLSDAYIKSLIKQRNSRMDRRYSPIIFDESDSPIKEERIPMYYEMNRRYFEKDNSKVLVVSQKDSAVNYMAKVIDINSLKE